MSNASSLETNDLVNHSEWLCEDEVLIGDGLVALELSALLCVLPCLFNSAVICDAGCVY